MERENRNEEMEQGGERRYYARPKICQFCADKNLAIDYKTADVLRRFVTDEGKIRPRRQTGTCAKHQRLLAGAIKRARHIALLPFTGRVEQDRPYYPSRGEQDRPYPNRSEQDRPTPGRGEQDR